LAKKGSSTEFRDHLWDVLFERADGLDGRAVAEAFRDGAQEAWDGGMDKAWDRLTRATTGSAKRAFDTIWITTTSRQLQKLREKQSKKAR
jgi:hypothetical protein